MKLYVSDKQLAERFGVTFVTIWRWAREYADFPKPYKLSPGCSRWKISEIEAWEKTREAAQ